MDILTRGRMQKRLGSGVTRGSHGNQPCLINPNVEQVTPFHIFSDDVQRFGLHADAVDLNQVLVLQHAVNIQIR